MTDKNQAVVQTNMECSSIDSNDRLNIIVEDNATSKEVVNHSTKIISNTTFNKDGKRNSSSPKFTEKMVSEKCERPKSNLNGQHDDSDGPIYSPHDTENRSHAEFTATSKVSIKCNFHGLHSIYCRRISIQIHIAI